MAWEAFDFKGRQALGLQVRINTHGKAALSPALRTALGERFNIMLDRQEGCVALIVRNDGRYKTPCKANSQSAAVTAAIREVAGLPNGTAALKAGLTYDVAATDQGGAMRFVFRVRSRTT